MFQPRKQVPNTNIKLPKLPGQPGFDDVQFLLIQAQRSRGRTVEMPWNNDDRTFAYMLTARCEIDGGEPAWLLYKGRAEANQIIWSYASGDVSLIFNLVISETGGGLHESTAQDSYASAPMPAGSSGSGQVSTAAYEAVATQTSTGAFNALKAKSKAILEGDLTNMQPPNLLQSISISKLTGRLNVQSPTDVAEIFFFEGAPCHALTREARGDAALIELITWESGEFHFFPDERTTEETIRKRLDAMLMEGVAMLDQLKYLSNQGLKMESYLVRKHSAMTEVEFEQAVSRGAPIDMTAQKSFYQTVDGRSTLFEILRRRPMSKGDWVPVMFNMLSCGLISLSDQSPLATQAAPLEAMGIDRSAIQGVLKNLSRTETGIFTYPTLLYFLEREFFRFESCGLPFSILIFEARTRSSPTASPEPLPLVAVKEMARRLNAIKRNLDIISHYETFDYAMMLPNTNCAAAAVMANRVAEVLYASPLAEDLRTQRLALALGVASTPEDCRELGLLLSAACQAKNQAKQGASPVLLFRNLKQG